MGKVGVAYLIENIKSKGILVKLTKFFPKAGQGDQMSGVGGSF